jgi:hypothetical protein
MFLKTVLLTSLAEELFAEVVERRKLDPRWSKRRLEFYKERGMEKEHTVWPFGH